MKSSLRFLMIILVGFGLLGCESKNFKAERQMWRARKIARAIFGNPKGTPPYEFIKAQDAYLEIIKKYPKSFFAVYAQFNIGHLFLAKGEFEKARQEYRKLAIDCDKNANLCANAYSAVGNSYEVEGRWGDALAQYRKVMRDFPYTSKSVELPLYIIAHERQTNNQELIKPAVDEAVKHYDELSRKIYGEKGRFLLQSKIVSAYMAGQQWQDALTSLDKIASVYPKYSPEEAIWVKGLIYFNKLKDKPKAKEELQRIVRDYPHSRLAKAAEQALKKL